MTDYPFQPARILQASTFDLPYIISSLAFQFAILGDATSAHSLVWKLNAYDPYHGQHINLRPLWLLWDLQSSWPIGEEERVLSYIEKGWKRLLTEQGLPKSEFAASLDDRDIQNRRITRQDVNNVVRALADGYRLNWWWPLNRYGNGREDANARSSQDYTKFNRETAEKEIEMILEYVQGADEEVRDSLTSSAAASVSTGLVIALDLAIAYEVNTAEVQDTTARKATPSPQEIFTIIAERMNFNQQIQKLVQSQQAWRYLYQGILLQTLHIDKYKLAAFTQDVVEAIDRRMANGRLQLPHESMQSIVRTLDDNTLHRSESLDYIRQCGFEVPSALTSSPVLSQAITDIEQRLGINLPEDYKIFISCTNGLHAPWNGNTLAPPLFPAQDIRWVSDEESSICDLTLDIPAALSNVGPGLQDYPTVGRVLVIGSEDAKVNYVWLIPPPTLQAVKNKVASILEGADIDESIRKKVMNAVRDFAGSLEEFEALQWCCVTWDKYRMQAFPNFRGYLQTLAANGKMNEDEMLYWRRFIGYGLRMGSHTL